MWCFEFILSKIFLILNGIEKNTIDDSVRFIPIGEKTKEKDFKPNTIKNNSNPKKQYKKISQNNKKFLKKFHRKIQIS